MSSRQTSWKECFHSRQALEADTPDNPPLGHQQRSMFYFSELTLLLAIGNSGVYTAHRSDLCAPQALDQWYVCTLGRMLLGEASVSQPGGQFMNQTGFLIYNRINCLAQFKTVCTVKQEKIYSGKVKLNENVVWFIIVICHLASCEMYQSLVKVVLLCFSAPYRASQKLYVETTFQRIF